MLLFVYIWSTSNIYWFLRISIGLSVFRWVANEYQRIAIRLLLTIHNIWSAIWWAIMKVILNYLHLPRNYTLQHYFLNLIWKIRLQDNQDNDTKLQLTLKHCSPLVPTTQRHFPPHPALATGVCRTVRIWLSRGGGWYTGVSRSI